MLLLQGGINSSLEKSTQIKGGFTTGCQVAVIIIKDQQRRKDGFDQIPNENGRGMGELSDAAYRVYMFLHSQAEQYEPTAKKVARAMSRTELSVLRAFSELKQYGYMNLERIPGSRKYKYIIREDPRGG